jgi:hypothetical protein
MLKSLNMVVFLFGIILIVMGYSYNIQEVHHPKIEYRYIHKNLYDDLIYSGGGSEIVWDDMSSIKPYNA